MRPAADRVPERHEAPVSADGMQRVEERRCRTDEERPRPAMGNLTPGGWPTKLNQPENLRSSTDQSWGPDHCLPAPHSRRFTFRGADQFSYRKHMLPLQPGQSRRQGPAAAPARAAPVPTAWPSLASKAHQEQPYQRSTQASFVSPISLAGAPPPLPPRRRGPHPPSAQLLPCAFRPTSARAYRFTA
jgi:hypothetical protein